VGLRFSSFHKFLKIDLATFFVVKMKIFSIIAELPSIASSNLQFMHSAGKQGFSYHPKVKKHQKHLNCQHHNPNKKIG